MPILNHNCIQKHFRSLDQLRKVGAFVFFVGAKKKVERFVAHLPMHGLRARAVLVAASHTIDFLISQWLPFLGLPSAAFR